MRGIILRLHSWQPRWGYLLWLAYHRMLRLLRPKRPARTYFGATMECNLGELIQKSIFQFGVWEPSISAQVESRLGRGDVFVDVGANVGYYSLLAASQVGPSGKVVAIEPSSRIFAKLRDNVGRNGADQVRLVRKAVGAQPGAIALYRGPSRDSGLTTTIAGRGMPFEETVEVDTLLNILTAEELAQLRLIKIDVEGAEVPILRYLLEHIDAFPPTMEIIVEIADEAVAEGSELVETFRANGFEAWAIEGMYDTRAFLAGPPRVDPVPATLPFAADVVYVLLTRVLQVRGRQPSKARSRIDGSG